ncbi:unnamed protein product [Polarella glacialis]|uniref:Large ribosomal subunit protein uL29c n=1 Tax=Polarella glacialis TaxID=89957 RepID=A0A813FYK6_POLGL|nr:unnamed protein product [Polarella glacialis]CAE8643731.1 unnamed protein product [Polarella glacialis]
MAPLPAPRMAAGRAHEQQVRWSARPLGVVCVVLAAWGALPELSDLQGFAVLRIGASAALETRRRSARTSMMAEDSSWQRSKPWWQDSKESLSSKLKVEASTDSIQRLRRQLTLEEAAFDQEIEDVVLSGKRALLRLRMQRAVETPGMKTHLFKKIRKQIARALTLRRQREIAMGITREQSRRMRRRKRIELKMQYEEAYGSEAHMPKSRRWLRRMGRIV